MSEATGETRAERLSFHASSTAAELKLGLEMMDAHDPPDRLVLLTENQPVSKPALGLLGRLDRAPALARVVADMAATLRGRGCTVVFEWLPAHCGIAGNETADKLAVAAHGNPAWPISEVPAFSDARLLVRRVVEARHPELENGPMPVRVPRDLPRSAAAALHRLRTDSAFTPAYLARWQDDGDGHCGSCLVLADGAHLLAECPGYTDERRRLRDSYSGLGYPCDTLEQILRPAAPRAKGERALRTLSSFLRDTDLCGRF